MPMRVAMEDHSRPQCVLCVHFYVTWDRTFPRGCRAFDIKAQTYPSVLVERESGAPCHAYARRVVDPAARRTCSPNA
jgi:hypothetical protein